MGFKLGTSGEAVIGFHCGMQTATWNDVFSTSACYYAIYKPSNGGTYIIEPWKSFWRPASATSLDPGIWNPDWANDRWQLKVTPTGDVKYYHNSVQFHNSGVQLSSSFKLHATFNLNGKVVEVKFLYEAVVPMHPATCVALSGVQ